MWEGLDDENSKDVDRWKLKEVELFCDGIRRYVHCRYLCTYMCMFYSCIYVFIHVCMYVCMYVCMSVSSYIHICACVFVCFSIDIAVLHIDKLISEEAIQQCTYLNLI